MNSEWALKFIGTGSSDGGDLGTSAAVLERSGKPVLLIDCGHGTPRRFHESYGEWPSAIFLTHVHLDHVSGLEQLHSRIALGHAARTRIYAPVAILAQLHQRVGSLENSLAEGRMNFWDQFQVVPVDKGFWHEGHWFDVFETRHHAPGFSHGLRLPGRFLFTGDTRPIPEVLRHYGNAGEVIFHDCSLVGNPSHTGLDDILGEYEAAIRERLVAYHYESPLAASALVEAGLGVARPGDRYPLGGEHDAPEREKPVLAPVTDLARRGFE